MKLNFKLQSKNESFMIKSKSIMKISEFVNLNYISLNSYVTMCMNIIYNKNLK